MVCLGAIWVAGAVVGLRGLAQGLLGLQQRGPQARHVRAVRVQLRQRRGQLRRLRAGRRRQRVQRRDQLARRDLHALRRSRLRRHAVWTEVYLRGENTRYLCCTFNKLIAKKMFSITNNKITVS